MALERFTNKAFQNIPLPGMTPVRGQAAIENQEQVKTLTAENASFQEQIQQVASERDRAKEQSVIEAASADVLRQKMNEIISAINRLSSHVSAIEFVLSQGTNKKG